MRLDNGLISENGPSHRIFEISKTAYSHNDLRDPEVSRDIKLRLLNQLLEEMILQEKADEVGITVSDDELQAAVKQIEADYPEGEFEEMLLESAVSFEDWKERLRIRLLTRKVIDTLIASEVVITPEDIQDYVNGHRQELPKAETNEDSDQIDAMILRRLRESKTERLYAAWINKQRSKIPVEINAIQWERVMNDNG